MGSDVIGVVVVALLACAALAYVAQPLLSGPRRATDDDLELAANEARERKRSALMAIVDIEEEMQIGKLSTQDFDALRSQYEAQALEALRELDGIAVAGDTRDDDLEAEIARMRQELTCPGCGAPKGRTPTCSHCGRS